MMELYGYRKSLCVVYLISDALPTLRVTLVSARKDSYLLMVMITTAEDLARL